MSNSGVRLDPTLVQAALEEAAPGVLEEAGALVAGVDGKLQEEDVPDRLTELSLFTSYDRGAAVGDATVFVSLAGDDDNDGLALSRAFLTIEAAYAALPATGGVIQAAYGDFDLAAVGAATGLQNDDKPVFFRGVGKMLTTIRYAGTGTAIRIGVGEGVTPFLDWGGFEDIQVRCTNAAPGVVGVHLDGAHRGSLTRMAITGNANPAGSVGLKGTEAYTNHVEDSLIYGFEKATELGAHSNDFRFVNTDLDGTGVVAHIIDSAGVKIYGGQISGLGSPCGVQVDAITNNCSGFELIGPYFDSGAGGCALAFKIGPAATSTQAVASPTIITAAPMGGTVDKADMATLIISNIVGGKTLTLTANCSDAWARVHQNGGAFVDNGTRTTALRANAGNYKASTYLANFTGGAGYKFSPPVASGQAFWVEVAGEANPKFTIDNAGGHAWGAGGGSGTDITFTRINSATMALSQTLRLRASTTAGRPNAVTCGVGAQMYDTTLSKPIWSDGAVWRDAAGTAV